MLDIGCADRWVESQLPPGTGLYVGLDYLTTGAGLYASRPDVFGTASGLPLADGSFEGVVMLEVLEHLEHPRGALHEIARVLKPGGTLLLSVPFLYPVHDAPHDYQRYTRYGLSRELDAAGFQDVSITPALGSAQSAGLIACLTMGGMALGALRTRSPALLLVPVLALLVPVVNLLAWIAAHLLPSWDATTAGYRIVATRHAEAGAFHDQVAAP